MREEFEKLAAAGKLEGKQIEPLIKLTSTGYCLHRSWGFGKITTVDTVFARFTIDFQEKPAHQMDLGFAAESLRPIEPTHILARKASDLEGLRQLAAVNHLDLIKIVLQSFEGKATLDQIQQVLVPEVIADDWKKWWEVAKKELKKSGHFLVPTKKAEPIVFQDQEVSLKNRLLGDFTNSKGLKAKINAATESFKNLPDLDEGERLEVAVELVNGLNADIATHQRTQPATALEGIFVREDIRQTVPVPVQEDEMTEASLWAQELDLKRILDDMPVAKHRRALESYQTAHPDSWHQTLLDLLNNVSTKLVNECISLLVQEKRFDSVKELLLRLINQHAASSELLLWLAKERSDSFADILGPEVFRAMLNAIERDDFNEKKSNKLRDKILDDQELITDLIESASLEVIKDLTRTLQLSGCFDDMDKRSLLARIVKTYPAVQSLISGGDPQRQDSTLIVSWPSLERRREEYNELVHKKIPANSKEIAIARSYGDLRENHEYKAAKEMQKVLMGRKAQLETDLARSRGTDFSNAKNDTVGVGTKVSVTDVAQNQPESFTILGAWDSDPDQGVISYLTPVAQALMNKKVGDSVEFDTEGLKRTLRIDAIAAVSPISGKESASDDVEGTASSSASASPGQPAGDAGIPSPDASSASAEDKG